MPYTDPTFHQEQSTIGAPYWNNLMESILEFARRLEFLDIPDTMPIEPVDRTAIDPVTGAIQLRDDELLTADDEPRLQLLEVPQTGAWVLVPDDDGDLFWMEMEAYIFNEQLWRAYSTGAL